MGKKDRFNQVRTKNVDSLGLIGDRKVVGDTGSKSQMFFSVKDVSCKCITKQINLNIDMAQ